MSEIDGRRGLAELTIPGTHDSGARRGGLRLETQALDLAGQLAAGIRFLDIRLNRRAGALRVFHGEADQGLELGADVVAPVAAFLGDHPGETVVMSVKQEAADDPAAFAAAFERSVADGSFHTAPAFPRLEEARGRIVLLRRYAGGSLGIAAEPADWRDDATFAIAAPGGWLRVEDEWRLALGRRGPFEAKWAAVAGSLAAAAAGSAADWHLTFTSATGDIVYPRLIALGVPFAPGINRRLREYAAGAGGRLGTVVMDFPDTDLIERLIDVNRRA
jgi:1-phosphatidylinositol phosphodiesterase